eukprot:69731_1
MQPMTGTTDMTGTDTNTDGAQRQGFRKVLRLRLITIRIRMISAVKWQNLNQWKWRHHDHQRTNQCDDPKHQRIMIDVGASQITCNGINIESRHTNDTLEREGTHAFEAQHKKLMKIINKYS